MKAHSSGVTGVIDRPKSGMAAAPCRLRLALRDAIAASLGAMLAWELSHYLLGHPKPVFAAVTALVCLAPGLPSHLKQTWGLVYRDDRQLPEHGGQRQGNQRGQTQPQQRND